MAVANALAQSDFKIAVIESREPQSFDISQNYDLRVSAVTLETVDFLKNIDTVPVIEPDNEPFRIEIENKQDNPDPFTVSCTLNNEC